MNKRSWALFVVPFAILCSVFLSTVFSSAASAVSGTWKDNDTITVNGVDFNGITKTALGSVSKVPAILQVFKATSGSAVVYFGGSVDLATATTGKYDPDGNAINSENLTLTNKQPAAPAGSGTGSGTGSDGSDTPQAKCAVDGVGWLVCPVATFLGAVTDGAYGYAKQLLYFEVQNPFSTDPAKNPIYTMWSSVRNVANVVFVLAFFAVIFSQATSMGISAYGIRKMLPRIIAAAILVNLSYYICLFAIDISNIVGSGLKSLVDALPAAPPSKIDEGNDWQSLIANVTVGAAVIGVAVGMIALATGTVLAFVVFSLLAIVTALAIFMARHVLLIMLIILSPLAFVAYILPNAENLFDKWRITFIAMLVMFPLVSILFAGTQVASNVMRSTADQVGGDLAWLYKLFALAVLAIPLFGIPWIVKFSGGFIGRVAGMVNDRNKGLIDRARKAGDQGASIRRSELGSGIKGGVRGLGTKAGLNKAGAWGYNEDGSKKKGFKSFIKGAGVARLAGGAVSAPTRAGFGAAERESRKEAVAHRLAEARADALADIDQNTKLPTTDAVMLSARSSGVEGAKGAARVRARAMAAVDKIDSENVQNEKTLFYNTNTDPTGRPALVAEKMEAAVRAGDSVRARAMQEILAKETGTAGVEALRGVYKNIESDKNYKTGAVEVVRDKAGNQVYDEEGKVKTTPVMGSVGKSLRSSLLATGIKSKDSALDQVGLTGVSITTASTTPGTYTRLTLNEQLTQTDTSFQDGASSTKMTSAQAKAILDNPDVQNLLNPRKREILNNVIEGKPLETRAAAPDTSFPAAATPITYTSALRGYDSSDVGRMSNQEIRAVMSNVPIQKIPSEELQTLQVATSTGSSVNVDTERRSYNAAVTEELRKRSDQVSAEATYTSNVDAARQAAQAAAAAEQADGAGAPEAPRPQSTPRPTPPPSSGPSREGTLADRIDAARRYNRGERDASETNTDEPPRS